VPVLVGVALLFIGLALLLVGPPVLMYLSVRTGALARVDVADDAVIVRPRRLNRIWAMKSEVRVPLSQVVDVRADVPRASLPREPFRTLGTYFPGLIQEGRYRGRGSRSFWLVGRAPTVTVIDCRGGRFDRIVLQLGEQAQSELQRAVSRAAQ
jgi:hypothetical protein